MRIKKISESIESELHHNLNIIHTEGNESTDDAIKVINQFSQNLCKNNRLLLTSPKWVSEMENYISKQEEKDKDNSHLLISELSQFIIIYNEISDRCLSLDNTGEVIKIIPFKNRSYAIKEKIGWWSYGIVFKIVISDQGFNSILDDISKINSLINRYNLHVRNMEMDSSNRFNKRCEITVDIIKRKRD